jgi:hypothetical protein
MDEIYTISISLAVVVGIFIILSVIISMLGEIAQMISILVVIVVLILIFVPAPEWAQIKAPEWTKDIKAPEWATKTPEWVNNIKMPEIPPMSEWFKKKEVAPPEAPLTTTTMMPETKTESTPSSLYMKSVDMKVPTLSAPITSALDMTKGNEVFHVQGQFDYSMARAVCKSYGAQLATFDQIKRSHDKGAEWCEYGWSEDSMVLYPTQYKSWEKFKESEEPQRCGIPGVNGGYNNDTSQQLGANCYGKKPAGKITPYSFPKVKARPIPEYDVSPFNYGSWNGI